MEQGSESVARLRETIPPFMEMAYFPVVVLRMPARISETDIQAIFDAFEAMFRAEAQVVAIVDARSMTIAPTSQQRRRLMEWARRVEPLTWKYGLGTAYVTTNVVVRAALSAMSLIFENPTPSIYVESLSDAVAFATERLAMHGLEAPANLDALYALPPP